MSRDNQKQAFIPPLKIQNTLTNTKEVFEPLNPPFVGMYVCGPTVYNNPHIGNARPAVFFDVLSRYLTYLGYKVRYVRNITDVGHLTGSENDGEDRISKQAKLEQLEPMEIVNIYTNKYLELMDALNVKRPSISPTATGHIVEQIDTVQKILDAGLAYESEGSVYFDVKKYNERHNYGELSGRVIDELLANTRENLEGQSEKKNPMDFAIWKKASPEHLMRWNSPWGEGFPGWHLECSVMSTKYLGEQFDIHGGGMDLMFPHHECEIAQAKAANGGKAPVKYWMHNNMLTIDGVKMSKSPRVKWSEEALTNLKTGGLPDDLVAKVKDLNQPQKDEFDEKPEKYLGKEAQPHFRQIQEQAQEFVNFITIEEVFTGEHEILAQAYSPMTIRLFILQAHYRSTIDFSNKALLDAQKAYKKLMNSLRVLKLMEYPTAAGTLNTKLDQQINGFCDNALRSMNDDMNTAKALAQIFNINKKINHFYTHPQDIATIEKATFDRMKSFFITFIVDVFGLIEEKTNKQEVLIQGMLDLYKDAKENKDYDKVDQIRTTFKESGLLIKDLKTGVDWAYEE
ncbi:cysteine--tRNA ligase [Microscilla marina]|uniref:Cysteine--tRNA ligase n=1 Tax=Microscilla marina ATCC 23134 TaxID=313606 RepID=A1ZEG5_MICM2|nr:cysteine--tRNA ligase [Microscilla marina]EAY31473.1 cysteinyl-tRNA synthetase [Microscilla marina ATCC 23134]